MEHQISIVTLAIKDLEGTSNWYKETFGWEPVIQKNGAILFRLDRMFLVLADETKLAKDLYVWEDGEGFKRFVLTLGFNSEKELDNKFEELHKKGVTIIKAPQKTEDGIYKGYISDPEENFWELAFYPFVEIDRSYDKFPKSEIIFQS